MAIYDSDANATTAVTAWLAQFKVASGGAITYVSGSDTFHVQWLDRALQKIAYDFATSGDDEINLSFPNPSKAEAQNQIITLYDHTVDFSVNYNVTDEVITYHFGGSVSQNDGDDVWGGLQILGKTDGSVPINVLQNNVLLTSHWGNGKNSTDSNTLARIMIKIIDAGVETDNSLVHVKLNKWLYEFVIWGTTMGLGEKVASVTSNDDPQNTTALIATVRAYDVSNTDGYNLIDLDGNGTKPYIGKWNWGTEATKKAVYEFVKATLCEDTTDTLYGVDGKLWTGRLYDCVLSAGTGTWAQNETLTWGAGATAGTGNLVAVDDLDGTASARIILHLNTGVFPADTETITGLGSATGDVSGTPSLIATSPNHTGTFTGAWIGADAIGFEPAQVTSADSFKDLDGNPITPPNNVPISGIINAVDSGDDPHVILALKASGVSAIEYDTYACAGGTSGDAFIDVDTISADVPQAGWVGVLRTGQTSREYYEYTSWSGVRFTLTGTISGDITASDPAHVAFFYESPVGGGTAKSLSSSLIYQSTPIDVYGWARQGDPTAPDAFKIIAGTIGSGGFAFTVNMERAG